MKRNYGNLEVNVWLTQILSLAFLAFLVMGGIALYRDETHRTISEFKGAGVALGALVVWLAIQGWITPPKR